MKEPDNIRPISSPVLQEILDRRNYKPHSSGHDNYLSGLHKSWNKKYNIKRSLSAVDHDFVLTEYNFQSGKAKAAAGIDFKKFSASKETIWNHSVDAVEDSLRPGLPFMVVLYDIVQDEHGNVSDHDFVLVRGNECAFAKVQEYQQAYPDKFFSRQHPSREKPYKALKEKDFVHFLQFLRGEITLQDEYQEIII